MRAPSLPPHAGNLVPFRIHALLKGVVVPPLRVPSGPAIRVGAGCCAAHESGPGADRCAGGRIAEGSADRCADSRPDQSPHGGPSRRVLIDGRPGRRTDLLPRPLPADQVVRLELFERFPGGGEHHHTRPGGNRRASAQDHPGNQYQKNRRPAHPATSSTVRAGSQGERPSSSRSDIAGRTGSIPGGSGKSTSSAAPGVVRPVAHISVAAGQPRVAPHSNRMGPTRRRAPTRRAVPSSAAPNNHGPSTQAVPQYSRRHIRGLRRRGWPTEPARIATIAARTLQHTSFFISPPHLPTGRRRTRHRSAATTQESQARHRSVSGYDEPLAREFRPMRRFLLLAPNTPCGVRRATTLIRLGGKLSVRESSVNDPYVQAGQDVSQLPAVVARPAPDRESPPAAASFESSPAIHREGAYGRRTTRSSW